MSVRQSESVRGSLLVEMVNFVSILVKLGQVPHARGQGQNVAVVQHLVAAGSANHYWRPLDLIPALVQLDDFVSVEGDDAAIGQPSRRGDPCDHGSKHLFAATVDLDELDLTRINPLPSWIWYQDMADFAEAITDERAGPRLARAIQGKGAFRRFKGELHEEHPDLLPAWYAFRDARAERRAVRWLSDNSLIDDEAAGRFLAIHADPDLP